ncbi:MAG: GNAT family protein [Geminicoccaceae bacterium]
MSGVNHLGQPIGDPLPAWTPRPRPGRTPLVGRYCRVEPLDPGLHGPALFAANQQDPTGAMWTYMGYGPFAQAQDYTAWAEVAARSEDPLFHAIVNRRSERAVGVAAYLRIEPAVGVLEVGHIAYAPALQRTAAATEAMYLLLRRAFDELGYRRYEWKCDALNAPSRAAALRLGFRFEGIFRQATVYKGRNRDTAWYSIIDREWPARRAAFEAWLDPLNFTADGRQIRPLGRHVEEGDGQ